MHNALLHCTMEQDLTVPMLSLIGGVITWLVFLTFIVFSTKEKVAVNTANDKNVGDKIVELKSGMTEMKAELKQDFSYRMDKLETHINSRLDSFFTQVIKGLTKE